MSERGNKILYVVLSLLLAIVFWLYVDNEQGNTTSVRFTGIPIDFIGADDTLPNRNLMLTSGSDATIDLRISGPRSMVSGLDKSDIRVQVDLSAINAAGQYTRSCSIYYPDTVDSSRINVDYRSRTAVTVQVSPLYSKTVPVTVVTTNNEVADGYIYMADRLSADPSSLTLRGREERVAPIASARVVIDLTGASSTVQQEYEYELLDSEGNVVAVDGDIRISERRIAVTAPIYMIKELPLTVKFKQSPGSMETDARWELSEETITVAGEPASLEGVEELSLGEVDLSQLLSNTEEQVLEIPLPAGCVNQSGYSTTTLTVRFRNLATRNLTVSNFIPVGLAEGQVFDRVTRSLDVTLRGPAEELEEVTEEDVRIMVDLTEYGSGTVSVPVKILVDGHENLVGAIGSYTVTCKISS